MADVRPIDANAIHFTKVLSKMGLDMDLVTKSSIDNMPTLDYAPVRHGEWIRDDTYSGKHKEIYYCSCCNHWQAHRALKEPSMNAMHMRYCPWCGAMMDGQKPEVDPNHSPFDGGMSQAEYFGLNGGGASDG